MISFDRFCNLIEALVYCSTNNYPIDIRYFFISHTTDRAISMCKFEKKKNCSDTVSEAELTRQKREYTNRKETMHVQ
jgi:hypothetical protein